MHKRAPFRPLVSSYSFEASPAAVRNIGQTSQRQNLALPALAGLGVASAALFLTTSFGWFDPQSGSKEDGDRPQVPAAYPRIDGIKVPPSSPSSYPQISLNNFRSIEQNVGRPARDEDTSPAQKPRASIKDAFAVASARKADPQNVSIARVPTGTEIDASDASLLAAPICEGVCPSPVVLPEMANLELGPLLGSLVPNALEGATASLSSGNVPAQGAPGEPSAERSEDPVEAEYARRTTPIADLAVGSIAEEAGASPTEQHEADQGLAAVPIAEQVGQPIAPESPAQHPHLAENQQESSDSSDPSKGSVIRTHLAQIEERYSASGESQSEAAVPGPSSMGGASQVENLAVVEMGNSVTLGSSSVVIAEDDLVSIKLGDLISLFQDRLDRPLFVWLNSSSAAERYVTPETLKNAGLDVKFDAAGRRIILGASK